MPINSKHNQKTGNDREKAGCILFLIFLVFISVGSCGCIKLMQQSTGSNSNQTMEALNPDPVKTVAPADPITPLQKNSLTEPTLAVTSIQSNLVTDAAPILPPDPYPPLHGTRINGTPENNRLTRSAEFTRTYTLRGNATGMIVNVVKAPLILSFVVNPLYDCLENPESCRGNLAASVNRPWMTITVRDNQTHEIVAEDGYGRIYSSDTGSYDYSKSITSTDPHSTEHSSTTVKVTTIPRHIALYKEGAYHVTLTGAYLDVTLSVVTGASPFVSDTQSPSASPTPAQTLSPEYLRYLSESGGEV